MFSPLTDIQLKNLIDSKSVFDEFSRTMRDNKSVKGSMYWQKSSGHEYLKKGLSGFKVITVGRRSAETEQIKSDFESKKKELKNRLESIEESLLTQIKLNRVYGVGHCPTLLVQLCRELERHGLSQKMMVIGTNALYGYETLAGVKFADGLLATMDVDLLWDSRSKLEIATSIEDENAELSTKTLFAILKKIDKSFEIDRDVPHRAINQNGYMVDLVRPRARSFLNESLPSLLSVESPDLQPAKIFDMNWLLSTPAIDSYFISSKGDVAKLKCPDPRAFALHKNWISEQKDRDPEKKRRDFSQAKAVEELVKEFLPQYALTLVDVDNNTLPAIPAKLKRKALKNGITF